jgi:hypothetical protein
MLRSRHYEQAKSKNKKRDLRIIIGKEPVAYLPAP